MKNPFRLVASFMLSLAALLPTLPLQADELSAIGGNVEFHPAVTAFFESKDPFVQEHVLPAIESNRKSDVALHFVGEDQQAMGGVQVKATLKRHEFLFGHCDLTTEKDARKRELLNELFYYTCPGNTTKWKAFAPQPGAYDFSRIDAMLDFCKKRDIALEWHFLSGYHPAWLSSITSDHEKGRLQMEHGRAVLERYGDKVRFFQVLNEDWLTHIESAKVYTDQTTWFSQLRKDFPNVELGVCDCWSYNKEQQLPEVAALRERYPGIDFIAMHAHRPRELWASPEEIIQTYDPYRDSGIKVHITEFGIIKGKITGGYRTGEWDDDKLAEYFVQAMATSFSHPAVRVFNLWSNYEKFTGNPLFTEEGEPNAKYLAIKSLLQDKLATRVAGRTDGAGRCTFRGFHGTYNVTVEWPSGKTSNFQAKIGKDTKDLKWIIDEQTGGCRPARTEQSPASGGAE